MSQINNDELKEGDIPSANADWVELAEFALTFPGYEVWGSFEKCAEVANAQRHDTLTELRTCLFFEQRRWRHFEEYPDDEAMRYIREIVEQIRRRVVSGDVD